MKSGTLTNLRILHLAIVAVAIAVGVAVRIIFRSQLPPAVPWLYSRPWGEDQLVPTAWLLLAPGLCLVTGALFGLLAQRKGVEATLAAMLLFGSMVIQLLLTLGLLRVVLLII